MLILEENGFIIPHSQYRVYWHPGGHLNIKMLSYQYRDPHVKDKTVSRPSFNMGIPILGIDGLYIESEPW